MDIRKVKKLIELLEESDISELEIKEGEESVRISRHGGAAPQVMMAPMAGLKAFSTDAFKQAMSAHNVTYLKADWTNYNPEIAAFLKQFNRNGIPLYLVYSGRADEPPQILPQLLTAQRVVEALERI